MTSPHPLTAMHATSTATRSRFGRQAGRLLSTAFLLVACALAALMLLPAVFGYERYVITGGSMAGSIDKGSLVVDEVVPTAQLRVGDVITYTPPSQSRRVTHRIAWIGRNGDGARAYQTKGDANTARDSWKFTLSDDTQARVSFSVPYVGYAVSAVADRESRMLIVGFPALLIALGVIARMWRESGRSASLRPVTAVTPKESV